MSRPLTRVVDWGHQLLAEKISKGELAVDLTAGNGYDALMLWRLVGENGQVIAFDIQAQALRSACQRLRENGATVRLRQTAEGPLDQLAGVDLVAADHEDLAKYLPCPPQGIIANLGFYPSGDRQIITRPQTTLPALQQASEWLAPGGRLAVVVYPGHPGGLEESAAVSEFFTGLDDAVFQVLQLNVINRPQAPYLLVAEKKI